MIGLVIALGLVPFVVVLWFFAACFLIEMVKAICKARREAREKAELPKAASSAPIETCAGDSFDPVENETPADVKARPTSAERAAEYLAMRERNADLRQPIDPGDRIDPFERRPNSYLA